MEQMLFSLNATVPIFLVMAVGYGLRRLHVVDEPFLKTLNSFNYKVTLPLLLFRDIAEADFYSVWDTGYVCFCFLSTLACISVIWLLAWVLYRDRARLGEFVQASYRSSAAVLGVAFIQNIYGTSGMAPLMIIGTVPLYNIAAVLVLSFTAPASQGLSVKTLKKSLADIAGNPIILGILLGLAASLCRISFPAIIEKTVDNISVLATPLALIGLGAGFEGRRALKLLKPTLAATLIKLMVLPAFFLPLAVRLGFRDEKLVALLVMLGAPTTVSCYIMAKNMGHEGVLTSSVVVAATSLSSVTLTALLFVLRSMGYI